MNKSELKTKYKDLVRAGKLEEAQKILLEIQGKKTKKVTSSVKQKSKTKKK